MAFNFGAFAGGLTRGVESGIKLVDSIDDWQKKNAIQRLQEQGMEEARKASAEAMANGQASVQEGPAKEGQSYTSETGATVSPVSRGSVVAQGLPPVSNQQVSESAPTVSPDQAGAATAASSMQPAANPVQTTPSQQQSVVGNGLGGAFIVNGEKYNTREQANAAVAKSAPSAADFFMKNAVPKIAEQYLANGDPVKAKAWLDYAETHNGARAMKDWAAAYTAPDLDTSVSRFVKYFTNHVDTDVDYVRHDMVTKADGTQVAVVELKDKATGKPQKIELTREKMLAFGGANNPQKLFETAQANQSKSDEMKFKYALEQLQRKQKNEDAVALEGVRHGNAVELEKQKREGSLNSKKELEKFKAEQEDQKLVDLMDRMEKFGFPPDEIRRTVISASGGKIGVGEALHPSRINTRIYEMLSDSQNLEKYPSTDKDGKQTKKRFSELTDQEQQSVIKNKADLLIYGQGSQTQGTAKPSIVQGKTMPRDSKLPVLKQDATGKLFHRLPDGSLVEISEQQPQAAGGLPKPPAAAPGGGR